MIAMNFNTGLSLLLTLTVLGTTAEADDKAKPPTDRHGDPLPPGAVLRLGTTHLRTTATAFVPTPDGRSLYTVAGGRTVGHWDAKTGRQGLNVQLPGPAEKRCWFAPDAKVLAVPDAGGIGLYDPTNGNRLTTLDVDDKSKVTAATFSPDHVTFATAENVNTPATGRSFVRVWSCDRGDWSVLKVKGRLIAELPSQVNALAFSPDGKRLYAAVDYPLLRCWDVATAKELWTNEYRARLVVASPDGKTLCTDSFRDGLLRLWDADNGRELGVIESEKCETVQIAFAPDGKTLAQGTDKGLYLWDVTTRKRRRHIEQAGGHLAFASDGASVFTLGPLLERWDVKTGKPLYPDTRGDGHAGPVQGITFAPDGRSLVSRGEDGRVFLWDIANGKPRLLRDKAAGLVPMTLTRDGRLVLTDEEAGAVVLFDVAEGKEIRRFHLPERVNRRTDVIGIRLTADNSTLLALGRTVDPQLDIPILGEKAPLRAWEVATGKELLAKAVPYKFSWYRSVAVFSADGRFVMQSEFAELRDVYSEAVRLLVDAPEPFRTFTLSPDGRFVALSEAGAGTDWYRWKNVLVYETLTGRRLTTIDASPGTTKVLAFSPDSRFLAVPGRGALSLLEIATGKRLLYLPVRDRLSNWTGRQFAECLAFAPDGRTLATGHEDGTILVWDLAPALAKQTVVKGPVDAAACWTDLAAAEPPAAWDAVARLASDPAVALPMLQKRLHAEKVEAAWLRDRLADLDSDTYDTRETATSALKRVAATVDDELSTAREKTRSEEVRRRLTIILAASRAPVPPAEVVRDLRAVAVLERIGTVEAQVLLKALADGTPGSQLTREAKAALQRLAVLETASRR